MKQTKIAKRLLTTVLAAAVMSLAACGGGGSENASDILPAGKVGTIGDGINQAEFDAVQCGMNRDQILAIVGDQPSNNFGGFGLLFVYPTYNAGFYFSSQDQLSAMAEKVLRVGTKEIQSTKC
jgi:hypothetical protein